ncbi:hypothetical protein A2U01_0028542 [Trifolium medium]|uniref:Uncharacterized protein n=1 Tax=Trifolium medium TaxID=97028 RepID=A0A392P5X2_9FABA|nr:hypothetical protein [Trifolium medium]
MTGMATGTNGGGPLLSSSGGERALGPTAFEVSWL